MVKTIRIEWKGPVTYDKAMREYYFDNDDRCDFGLYQIYGPHPLYSNKKRSAAKNILLYMGMAV